MNNAKLAYNGHSISEMKEILKEAGQALRELCETFQAGEIVETPYSVVWRDFYGNSFFRANYEENVTPCVTFEEYEDSAPRGITKGFQSLGEAKEYIASVSSYLSEDVFCEK